MIEGLFIGPGQKVSGMPSRLLSAVLPALSADPTRDPELVCLDLYQRVTDGQPRDWEWHVVSEIGRYSWGHTSGLNLGFE